MRTEARQRMEVSEDEYPPHIKQQQTLNFTSTIKNLKYNPTTQQFWGGN